MRKTPQKGITLLELLIAISLMGVIGVLCAQVLSIGMKSWEVGSHQNEALHEACWALDHIVNRARFSNQLLIPTAIDPTGDTLSFSAMVADEDGWIDEDPAEIWDYFIENGKLIEKYRTSEETEILAEGVTDFRIERVGEADCKGVTIVLTIEDSDGEEIKLQTLVFLRGLHFDPNNVL